MENTLNLESQCLWCGTQGVDILHRQFVLPLCPKCLAEFRNER